MPEKLSRRDLAKRGLAGAAALAVPSLAMSQDVPDADVVQAEKELAKSLTPETRKLLKTALKTSRDQAAGRMPTKLPDTSEPCFVYYPTPARKK